MALSLPRGHSPPVFVLWTLLPGRSLGPRSPSLCGLFSRALPVLSSPTALIPTISFSAVFLLCPPRACRSVSISFLQHQYLAKENSHFWGSWTAVTACQRTYYRGRAFCHTHVSSSWNRGPKFTLWAAVGDGKHSHCWTAASPMAWLPWHVQIFVNDALWSTYSWSPSYIICKGGGQGLTSSLPFISLYWIPTLVF